MVYLFPRIRCGDIHTQPFPCDKVVDSYTLFKTRKYKTTNGQPAWQAIKGKGKKQEGGGGIKARVFIKKTQATQWYAAGCSVKT